MKQITTILLALTTLTASAQLGVTGGIQYSSFRHGTTTAAQRNEPIATLAAGLYYRAGKTAGIKPAVMYSTKGAKTDYNGSKEYEFRTPYVEVSLPAFVTIGGVDFEAGPYIAWLTGTVGNYYFFDEAPLTWKVGKNWIYNTTDWGFKAGVSFRVDWISFDLLYSQGIRSVTKPTAFVMKGWQNRALSFQMSVPFKK